VATGALRVFVAACSFFAMPTVRSIAACGAAFLLIGEAFGAHPMLTEDPQTQGTGNFELELGQAFARGDPLQGGSGTEFAPQLTGGAAPALDIILRTTWLTQAPADAPGAHGWGDSMLDFKWRFHESASVAFAVRAGIDLPTGDAARGLGAGAAGYHVIAIAGWQLERINVNANVAYARVRQQGARADVGGVSAAVVGPNASPWRTFIEATAVSNPDPLVAQWPAVARTGLIYSATKWLDLDAGYQARLNGSATRAVWLIGATLRW
jgi:hypothetical protein